MMCFHPFQLSSHKEPAGEGALQATDVIEDEADVPKEPIPASDVNEAEAGSSEKSRAVRLTMLFNLQQASNIDSYLCLYHYLNAPGFRRCQRRSEC